MLLTPWFLLACTGATAVDSGATDSTPSDSTLSDSAASTTDSGSTGDTDSAAPAVHRWHALLTADGLLSKNNPPLVELDSDLERVWQQDFDDRHGRGAQGADRDGSGRTVFTRIDGDVDSGWVDLLSVDGTLAWTWDGESAGGLRFPHDVVFTPAGDLVVADTAASRLLSVDTDGQLLWEEPLPNTAPNGLDLRVADDGGVDLLVTGIRSLSGDRDDTEEVVSLYRLGERTGSPTLTWSRVLSGGASAGEAPHGPALLEDGTALYCARGKGQLVQLDANGDELWRSDEDSELLQQPLDVAQIDDALLVVNKLAGELLRIEDPFGAFELTDSAPLDGLFGVTVVWCGDDGGLPCLSDGR